MADTRQLPDGDADFPDELGPLADEFLAQHRQGLSPSITDYCQRHPALSGRIRDLFPTLLIMEQVGPAAASEDAAPQTSSSRTVPLPDRIGDFRIVREIGRGGMGVVYEAVQESLGRRVALKVLPFGAASSERTIERFRREARAAARLHHSHIVPVFVVGEDGGAGYYVMQYIHGLGLDQVLSELVVARRNLPPGKQRRRTALSVDRERSTESPPTASAPITESSQPTMTAVSRTGNDDGQLSDSHDRAYWHSVARLGMNAAQALDYAHGQGVLHRDIKPSNLLLDVDGMVWITDFGLAHDSDEVNLTRSGDVVGTLRYLAPERLQGISDRRSDVYSLGMTLYELLTLRPAYEESDRNQLLQQLSQQEPPRPRALDSNVPRDLETIVLTAIAKNPVHRYATAAALADDLRCFLEDRPVKARRIHAIERAWRWCRRNPLVAGLWSAVAALMVAAIVILAVSNAHIRREATAKDAAMLQAREAVDQMLRRVARDKLSDVPLADPLRAALLQDAVTFYDGFVSQGVADAELRRNMAAVLHELGEVQVQLARYDEARRSFQRSIDLWQALADAEPQSAFVREKLAAAQESMAFTVWQIRSDVEGTNDRQAESYFRQSLKTYADLERDWPDRQQPAGMCLRQLAELAHQRGEETDAENLLRQAIKEDEEFLEQHPAHVAARMSVCWACAQLDELILSDSPAQIAETERILRIGLRHVAVLLADKPSSAQAREVSAFLHYRLGRCYARTDRREEAVVLFRSTAGEINTLCADFPWNETYWTNACFFQRESVKQLQRAGRDDEARQLVRDSVAWFQDAAPLVPNEPGPQDGLRRCRDSLVKQLRRTQQPAEADALSNFPTGPDDE